MNPRSLMGACLAIVACALSTGLATASELTIGDAYARGSEDSLVWAIGTRQIEMTIDGRGGLFRLVSFLNKTCEPPLEYVEANIAAAPFSLDLEAGGAPSGGAPSERESQWAMQAGVARQVASGGRPAVQLDVTLACGDLVAQFHILAFPGTAILRQWYELENRGAQPVVLKNPTPARLCLRGEEATTYTDSRMVGGHAAPDQGKLFQAPVTPSYHQALLGAASVGLVPWMALHRSTAAKDGLSVALEFLGTWNMAIEHEPGAPLYVSTGLPELETCTLQPGQRLEMPWVTLSTFCDGLDNMASSLYDWQYQYLWDYTNSEFYARSRCATWWFYCSRNLQEQFTARLANLDVNTTDAMRTTGYEILWDDAGWSSYPGNELPPDGYGSVFSQTYEGPDFALTQRYLRKTGMRWLLWFAGRPSPGVLDTKIGAWGDFEWRTDGVGFPDMASDRSFRADVQRFLDAHPAASFHTCSGGSTYAHTFEIGGRFSSYNYLTDLGRGPYVNHYFSYLEPPDRWGDGNISILSIYGKPDGSTASMADVLAARGGVMPTPEDLRYVKEASRGMLTNVPNPYWHQLPPEDNEWARRDMELYRFFRCEGLAGRWSYVFHPAVQNDAEYYYFQRTSHDRLKACIIFSHRAQNPVVITPRGLLPEANYLVGFDSTPTTSERTGADLMANGIAIADPAPGELIYLNLPNRPRSGQDTAPPQPPGRVLMRREANIGINGIALYWAPGTDNNWISYYEIQRDGTIIDKVSIATYYFDHAAGWEVAREYAVRTVDGDGHPSEWRVAEPTRAEPMTFAALGGHFAEAGRDGWSAESSADGQAFTPMTWVPPAKNPAADFGGTPNQPGGVEGYWQSAGDAPSSARVGRGWQQASPTEACVRTWKAPQSGTVHIAGRAMREYYHRALGGPLQVKILHGQQQVWPLEGWAAVAVGDLDGAAHNLTLAVGAGDCVRFVLDKGTVPEHDLIAWMPAITYTENSIAPAPPAVRILCGAQAPYTDQCANVWAADTYFALGAPVSTTEAIENASPTPHDLALYQNGRAGKEFSYAIPVPPALYSVRLKFAEAKHTWMFERPISVEINGQCVLTDFDILQAAKAPKRAVDRAFRNIVPNAEGQIVLHFSTGADPLGAADDAMVQAIEILPEPGAPIRINAGSDTAFVDWSGGVWASDTGFSGGASVTSASPVVHAAPTLHDQALYRTARSGKAFTYTLTAPPGLYSVHLKFAELWLPAPGARPMDITVNGQSVRKAWDPATAAGSVGMAADIRVDNVAPDEHNHVTIALQATGANDAILQAIEIE